MGLRGNAAYLRTRRISRTSTGLRQGERPIVGRQGRSPITRLPVRLRFSPCRTGLRKNGPLSADGDEPRRGRAPASYPPTAPASVREPCGALIEPALELGDRDKDRLRPTPHDAQLGLDVLVEEVAAHAEHLRCFVRADRK